MAKKIYELKISLMDTYPSVYRTIQVDEDMTFYELHIAIQVAFDWLNYHIHVFEIGDDSIGMVGLDDFDDKVIDEKNVKLYQMGFSQKDIFNYTYDFGDDWVHKIQVMKVLDLKDTFYPKCIRGARNAPPEDCGGVGGFEEFKEIMGNRKHTEFKEMKEWYGGMYDEDLFLKEEINKAYKDFSTTITEMDMDFET